MREYSFLAPAARVWLELFHEYEKWLKEACLRDNIWGYGVFT